jgi:hypothetical protein
MKSHEIPNLIKQLSMEEGKEVINKSNIRPGRYSKGPFWWDYMVGV